MQTPRSQMFRNLLEKDPDNAMVLYSLGSELFREGDYQGARDYLLRAVERKPDYSVAYRMLGRAHGELGETVAARETFERGRSVAERNGDLQTVKEIDVFRRRLEKRGEG